MSLLHALSTLVLVLHVNSWSCWFGKLLRILQLLMLGSRWPCLLRLCFRRTAPHFGGCSFEEVYPLLRETRPKLDKLWDSWWSDMT